MAISTKTLADGDKRYRGEFTHQGRKVQGKWIPSKADARNWVERTRARVTNNAITMEGLTRTTVRDWADLYAEDMESRVQSGQLRATSATRETGQLYKYVVPEFGDMDIDQLSTTAIERWLESLLADGHSHSSVVKLRGVLNRVFVLARKHGAVDGASPTNGIRIRKGNAKAQREHVHLSRPQLAALLEATPNAQARDLFYVAAHTGLRQGELLALRVHHLDFDRGLIAVEDNVIVGVDGKPTVGSTKGKRRREVPMMKHVADVLLRVIEGANRDDLVFANEHGGFLDGNNLYKRHFRPAAETLDTVPVFHDLRHTFARTVLEAGGTMAELQHLLGHKTMQITSTHYGHLGVLTNKSLFARMEEGGA